MASASYSTTGVGQRRSSIAEVGAACVIALISFLVIYKFGFLSILGGALALGFLWLVIIKPEAATLLFVAVMYSNAAAVAVRVHHVPAAIAMGSFLLVFFPMLYYVVGRREGIRIDAVFVLMAVYFTILVVSALFSTVPMDSRESIVNYVIEGMVIYFLVINTVRTPEVLLKSVRLIAIVAAVLGALAAIQWVTQNYDRTYAGFSTVEIVQADGTVGRPTLANDEHVRGEEKLRAFGPVADPNFFGQIMAAAFPLALIPALVGASRRVRLLTLGCAGLILAGVVLSYSRGAAIAVVIPGICMFFLRYFKLWHGLVFAAIIAAVVASNPDYTNRITTLVDARQDGIQNAEPSVRDRALILQAGTQRFLQHPILGIGPGQSPAYIGTYDQASRFGSVRDVPLHNTYLQQLVETGIVGFLCFMTIVYCAMRNLLRTSRYWKQASPEYAHVSASLFLALIGFLSASLFLHMPYVMLRYYSLLLGLSGAAVLVYRPGMTLPAPQVIPSPKH